MNEKKSAWIKEILVATKKNIGHLHPCFALCGKWTTCEGETECLENIGLLSNVWRGKAIALNALES
jgi:hypothetical protein